MIPKQTASVRVQEPFKGSRGGQVFALVQPGNDCAPKFKEGERVLLYLHPSPVANSWEAFGCGRTRSLDTAADDLLFLRALPGLAHKVRLAGEIAVYEESISEGFRRSHALSGIHVHFRSAKHSADAVTNENGVYESYDLPADRYQIGIDVPKGLRIDFPIVAGGQTPRDRLKDLESTEPTVELGDKGADVDFVLIVDSQISGRVLDPAGKPVKDVCVQLQPATGRASQYFMSRTAQEVMASIN